LIDDHRTKNWAKGYFLRARALRAKDRIADALDCYEMAAKLADDLQLSESAELEMASMLIKLSGKDGYPNAEKQALALLEKLTQSKNIETKVSALTTQGFLDVRTDKNKATSRLNCALGLAENAQLTRHMMQIYHGLGSAYLDSNSSKALYYFEKSLSVRDQTRSTYGSLDLEADYFAYESISIIYRSRKKYYKSAQASKECVAIDRKLGLLDKLAHSLYELGMDLCFLKDYHEARKVLEEGLSLIRKNHFGHKAEIATLEWYIKALWYTQDFERSIEHLLEYMVLLQNVHGSSRPHLILRNRDMPPRERGFDYKEERGNGIHILVLPNEFDFPDVDGWFQKVIDRRPDLSSIKPVFFRK
jgi:tetratricopeptide (TPR) repeat protein